MNTRMNLMMSGYGMQRIFRAPDGVEGGGTGTQGATGTGESTQGGNNQQGNSTQNGNGAGTQNNTGTGFDPTAFWTEPEAPKPGSPKAGSAESGVDSSGQQQQQVDHGKAFADQIANYDPGPLFTKEIADQIAAGNLDGVNAALKQKMQGVAQQSLVMTANLLKVYGERLQSQMEARITAALGNRDNTQSLTTTFPSYADPAMKPVIDGVFAQAMKLSKGDRTAAITSTREMLKYMGKSAGPDLGITTPPGGPADEPWNSTSSKSLVDELLGR